MHKRDGAKIAAVFAMHTRDRKVLDALIEVAAQRADADSHFSPMFAVLW